jgi:crotonobetainyl-CoA:carnitine CoA-transferase CaiB-like acyl-CoA transferase
MVIIGVQNHAEWISFCEKVLNKPELIDDLRFSENKKRVQNRTCLDAEIKSVFGKVSKQELIARLHAANTAYGFVNSVADLCKHPQLRRVTVQIPGGWTEIVAPPIIYVDEEASLGPVPLLGEHSYKLRKEFCGQADQFKRLHEKIREI